jgi:hypothetical protein
MDEGTISREKQEEIRASPRELLNPEAFYDSLEEEISEADRAILTSKIGDVINENFGPLSAKRETPITEVDQLTEQFDTALGVMSRYFPDGLPEPTDQITIKPNIDKTLEKLDSYNAKNFERDLVFAKTLSDHRLEGFLNSLATDPRNALPEG